MPEFCPIAKDDDGNVITINRPEVMNSLHPPANFELDLVFQAFEANARTGEHRRALRQCGRITRRTRRNRGTACICRQAQTNLGTVRLSVMSNRIQARVNIQVITRDRITHD